MSIGENMFLGNERGSKFKINWNETGELATKYLKTVGLKESHQTLIKDIGVGKQQLIEIAKALAKKVDLLILDEPTNFVDNSFEREFYAMVQELSHNMAVMIVSHDLGTITSVVKSIVCVNRTAHRHDSNVLTEEQLRNYNCPIQIVSHGHIPHTVLEHHSGDGCKHHE